MKKIIINQAKPNPIGKDRFGHLTPNDQLNGEWVDFKNIGDETYSLDGIKLQHIAYTANYPNGVWDDVTIFNGNLEPGKVIRVHSGKEIPNTLRLEDSLGADYHLFTNDNYIWNNDKSDSPRLITETKVQIDKATYIAYPTEGKILKRSGDYLI